MAGLERNDENRANSRQRETAPEENQQSPWMHLRVVYSVPHQRPPTRCRTETREREGPVKVKKVAVACPVLGLVPAGSWVGRPQVFGLVGLARYPLVGQDPGTDIPALLPVRPPVTQVPAVTATPLVRAPVPLPTLSQWGPALRQLPG